MSTDLPDPTLNPPPRRAPTRISDTVGDEIKICLEPPRKITIFGGFDVWHFSPDQAVRVAHAILGYVNEITGDKPRYVVGTITHAEPTFLYAPEDMGAS